ncbi:hypothetical protein [Pseudomonas cedrina]|uniref:hypothetical protein n=1 Tax=Pseudomonas cedrina TaxID=651740 RepID=UPI00278589AA|nr:hypothetical protein [Pseudomonas cedrina]MDQ0654197.1 hypothetical protein [Pseudomonas cedrina]
MVDFKKQLPVSISRQADKIMAEIQKSGSMIMAVKAGARANGFVLGLQCSASITDDAAQLLQTEFDISTEIKLKELSVWSAPQY